MCLPIKPVCPNQLLVKCYVIQVNSNIGAEKYYNFDEFIREYNQLTKEGKGFECWIRLQNGKRVELN